MRTCIVPAALTAGTPWQGHWDKKISGRINLQPGSASMRYPSSGAKRNQCSKTKQYGFCGGSENAFVAST